MMLVAILATAAAIVGLSEISGRGRVIYTRVVGLAGAYVLCVAAAGTIVLWRGAAVEDALAIALSTVPVIAAWLGFRIHLTNSISLELLELLRQHEPTTAAVLERAYDAPAHAARRVDVLQQGGYLTTDLRADVVDTLKARVVLGIIAVVCGAQGPQSVVSGLERRARP